MTRPFPFVTLAASLVAACGSAGASPVSSPGLEAAGFYSSAQASRGASVFRRICAECHSSTEFRGDDFEWDWRRQTVWDFYREITTTMPEDDPGGLADETYADVIAYILELNGYAAGGSELTATETAMDVIPLGPGAAKTPQGR